MVSRASVGLAKRRENAAIELANAQLFQALEFSDLATSADIQAVYKALLDKAVSGHIKAIDLYLNRLLGPDVVQIERMDVNVSDLVAMALGQQQHKEIGDDEVVVDVSVG